MMSNDATWTTFITNHHPISAVHQNNNGGQWPWWRHGEICDLQNTWKLTHGTYKNWKFSRTRFQNSSLKRFHAWSERPCQIPKKNKKAQELAQGGFKYISNLFAVYKPHYLLVAFQPFEKLTIGQRAVSKTDKWRSDETVSPIKEGFKTFLLLLLVLSTMVFCCVPFALEVGFRSWEGPHARLNHTSFVQVGKPSPSHQRREYNAQNVCLFFKLLLRKKKKKKKKKIIFTTFITFFFF